MDSKIFFDNFETIANAPGGITRLRELILDLAVSGKLLTRSSSDTPVSALLALIKSKHEPHGLMSEPRFLIPDHWEWVAIGTIAEHQLGKMLNKSRTDGVARKYLRTANVASHGGFDLSLVKEMIIPEEELEKYSVRKGDLFVNEGGDVGKCAIWTSNMEDFAFQNHLHRLRPLGRITSRYLQLVLQQARNSGALLEMSAGVTIQNLSANTIRKLACPLAPPAEQERIIAKVDELMTLCDQLESELIHQRTLEGAIARTLTSLLFKDE
jgi:type I restriction enzyme, S subunit